VQGIPYGRDGVARAIACLAEEGHR
jgi:hypothetical protein